MTHETVGHLIKRQMPYFIVLAPRTFDARAMQRKRCVPNDHRIDINDDENGRMSSSKYEKRRVSPDPPPSISDKNAAIGIIILSLTLRERINENIRLQNDQFLYFSKCIIMQIYRH